MEESIIILIWLVLTLLEAYRNYYMIVKLHKSINHRRQFIIRSFIGLFFWITCAPVTKLPFDQWLAMPLMMVFVFWNVFDISLNLMRGKEMYYFGLGSWWDRKQREWPMPWMFFKALFMIASILLFYKGFNAVV